MKKYFALGLVASLVLLLTSKLAALKKLDFYPKDILIKRNGKKISATFLVDVINKTSSNIDLKDFYVGYYYNDTLVGQSSLTKAIIQKKQTTTLKLPVKIFPVGVGLLIADIIYGKRILFKVVGSGSTAGVPFEFDKVIKANA